MTDPRLPQASLPVSTRAPGKCILFGEHAVVHGQPELLLAIDLHTQVTIARSVQGSTRLNADPAARETNPYFRRALERRWTSGESLDVTATSRIPRSAGLGSSAAFVAGLTAGLSTLSGPVPTETLAQDCFTIEREAQGVGSPGDTSASVAGGYVALNSEAGTLLWQVAADSQSWTVRRVVDPGWVWVVAYTGIPRSTPDAVRAFADRVQQHDGPALLERFSQVASSGIDAVRDENREETGRWMIRNQELLRDSGVSHPRLEALLEAVRPSVVGSKLTGAGRGGSIVALPLGGKELETSRRIARVGGVPYVVRPAKTGVSVVGHA